jgi:hypothetical protein
VAHEVSHLTVRLAGRDRSAFRVCGVVGLVAAGGLASALAGARGLSLVFEGTIIALAVLTFFALALATKVLSGRETLIYHHHEQGVLEIVALAVCVAVLLPLGLVEARRTRGRLRSPRHVREVADALDRSRREAAVVATSEGVLLSAGVSDGVAHYTVSAGPAVAELVRRLRHPDAPSRILAGRASVLHLVIGGHDRT